MRFPLISENVTDSEKRDAALESRLDSSSLCERIFLITASAAALGCDGAGVTASSSAIAHTAVAAHMIAIIMFITNFKFASMVHKVAAYECPAQNSSSSRCAVIFCRTICFHVARMAGVTPAVTRDW